MGDESCKYHVNACVLQYPDSEVTRYAVPDELIPWNEEFPGYDPPIYNDDRTDRGNYNPEDEMRKSNRKYNSVDGACDTYQGQDGLPLNPIGRTGLRGVGSLHRFGPNHSQHPVLTRWKNNQKASKKILEVLVVKREEDELWSLPGGMLDLRTGIPEKIEELLLPGYLWEFLVLLDSGTDVYRGYLDDFRNTDNAWIETRAVNVHLDTKERLEKLQKNLKESDGKNNNELSVRWQILDYKIPVYPDQKEILQKTAEHLNANDEHIYQAPSPRAAEIREYSQRAMPRSDY